MTFRQRTVFDLSNSEVTDYIEMCQWPDFQSETEFVANAIYDENPDPRFRGLRPSPMYLRPSFYPGLAHLPTFEYNTIVGARYLKGEITAPWQFSSNPISIAQGTNQ